MILIYFETLCKQIVSPKYYYYLSFVYSIIKQVYQKPI